MATETIKYNLEFNNSAQTSLSYAFDSAIGAYRYRTENWELDMEVIESGFYGYGYGLQYYDLDSETPGLDYFHVLGVKGNSQGYGLDGTQGSMISSYTFGWGYEFTSAILSNNSDELTIRVTVRENGVIQPNIKVVFRGSPGVNLSQNVGYTDSNGEITITATMDNSVIVSSSFESRQDITTYEEIGTINGAIIYGNILDEERRQFRAQLPVGTVLSDYGLELSEDENFLSNFRVNIEGAGSNNEYGGNLFEIEKITIDQFVDNDGVEIPYYEIVYKTPFDYPSGSDPLGLLAKSESEVAEGYAIVVPDPPTIGNYVKIIYDANEGILQNSSQVYLHLGYNDWAETFAGLPMTKNSNTGYWEYNYIIPTNAAQIEFVFNNGSDLWDNNSENNWVFEVNREKLEITDTDSPTKIAVIGDYGYEGENLEAVSNMVKGWNPDYICTTGDNNYNAGSAETIDDNIGKYFYNFINPYLGAYGSGADTNRFFPVPGNHDWDSSTGLQPYLDYFTLPDNERYYDVRIGDIHIFALDTDEREPDGVSEDSIQAQWLQSAMGNSDAKFKLVFLHHSPYSSGTVHGGTEYMRWPFADWGATAVFGGNEHNYERFTIDGIPYFVVGNGGRSLYNVFTTPLTISESEIRFDNDYGALLIEIGENQITFNKYSVNGNLVDSYMIDNGEIVNPIIVSNNSEELPFPDIFENITIDIVQADTVDEGGTVTISENLPLAGYLSVRGIIEKQIGSDQRNINIETESIQLFDEDSAYKLNFDSYGFQRFFNYA